MTGVIGDHRGRHGGVLAERSRICRDGFRALGRDNVDQPRGGLPLFGVSGQFWIVVRLIDRHRDDIDALGTQFFLQPPQYGPDLTMQAVLEVVKVV